MQDGYRKLQQRKHGSYQIIKKINNNVYVVVPNWIRISKTFNVADLTLFQSYMNLRYPESNLRTSSSQVEMNDIGR